MIHPTAVIDEHASIGTDTCIWHFSHVMNDAIIGNNCNLGQNVVVCSGARIGNRVKIQNNVSVYTGVICEDEVFIGPSVVFTNVINPRSAISRKHQYLSTLVSRGASLGANATIVCGVSIGQYAFVGAGAVIIRSVPAYGLVVGNPARQIGWVSEYGHRLSFDKSGRAICTESGQVYQLTGNSVSRVS